MLKNKVWNVTIAHSDKLPQRLHCFAKHIKLQNWGKYIAVLAYKGLAAYLKLKEVKYAQK